VGEQVARAAVDWIGGGARVLEVGIGTGRIAKPLLALGMNVTGLDLSAQMLAHLQLTLPAEGAVPALVLGDANYLPLAAGAFDAVISVHMFQLLADWGNALSGVRRVLRLGGVFLNGYEWRPPASPGARLMARWRGLLEAAGQPALAIAARDFGDLKNELLQTGAAYREQNVGQWSTTRTLARQLETIEHRAWSLGAREPNGDVVGCLAQLRSWASAEFGALDRAHTVPHHFVWQRFDWP
jgi:ubiquinone/menaquinone biosynthesis C-methylase UbiE